MRHRAQIWGLLVVAAIAAVLVPSDAKAITSNPTGFDFGNVPINTESTETFLINVDASYTTELASGSGINAPFSFNFETCSNFSGAGTCSVGETFAPTSIGAANGTLNLFECPNAGGTCIPVNVGLAGNGVSVAAAGQAAIDFGNVPINTKVTTPVEITVDAGYEVELASGSGINSPFSFSFDTCSNFDGAGTCTIDESYQPTSLTGSNGTTNVFECPIAGGQCIAIPFDVTGDGISVASTSGNVDFGNVPINTTASAPVDITVDAGYQLDLASGSGINSPFSFDFDTCSNFDGSGTCEVDQRFHPTALGDASGTTNVFECPIIGGQCIAIPYNVNGDGISVAGAGGNLDFGLVPLGTTSTLPVDITVDAGYSPDLASGTGINPPFNFGFGSCFPYDDSGACTIDESFTPSDLNPAIGLTNVFECPNVGGQCIAIPFGVSGQGEVPAPEPSSLSLFGLAALAAVTVRRRTRNGSA